VVRVRGIEAVEFETTDQEKTEVPPLQVVLEADLWPQGVESHPRIARGDHLDVPTLLFSPRAAQAAALREAMGTGGDLGDAASAFETLADIIERLGQSLEDLPIEELRGRSRRG